jgi:hypothetical protein
VCEKALGSDSGGERENKQHQYQYQQAGRPKTRARAYWEFLHKNSGRLAIALGLINILLGMYLILAPRAVWIVYLCFVFVGFCIFALMEVRLHMRARSPPGEKLVEAEANTGAPPHRLSSV